MIEVELRIDKVLRVDPRSQVGDPHLILKEDIKEWVSQNVGEDIQVGISATWGFYIRFDNAEQAILFKLTFPEYCE